MEAKINSLERDNFKVGWGEEEERGTSWSDFAVMAWPCSL
jgi:hypothetical protein